MSQKKWSPLFGLGVWVQLFPLLIMFTVMWITAWRPFNLGFGTVKFWEYLVFGWTYAAAVYLLGLICFVKYLRAWWLAAVFACIYLFLYGVNAGFLYHTGFILGPYYVWIARPTAGLAYIVDYFTHWIVVITVIFLFSTILAAWLIRRNRKTLATTPSRWLVLLALLCYLAPYLRDAGLFNPTYIAATVAAKTVGSQLQGVWRLDQTYSLRLLAENPLVILGRSISVHRLQPLQPRPASDLTAVADALKTWGLPMGYRQYPPLHLKPFNRIVMFGTESLSLDFLAPYNTNLPQELTPFYGSPEITNRMFVNYQCVAGPTQPGLAVTFNSHPNIGGLLTSGYEQSLIKYLDAEGYDTYFLMSGPETFLNDNVVFKNMGFKHVIGSQTWLKDPRYAPFIQDRGLMDQVLYHITLDCLEANRGKKIFIQVMNCDTHSPTPRTYYGSLQYPPYPTFIQHFPDSQTRIILDGIFRHDYDIGQTIKQMRERNLLTEDTLVILTADHSIPRGGALSGIPGYPETPLSRIPLAFLSGQTLPTADLHFMFSQLDFAPTVVHLLGLPMPVGWWGESIFAPDQNAPFVSKLARTLRITPPGGGPQQTISLDNPKTPAEKELITAFTSVYTNNLPFEPSAQASSQ